MEVAVQEYCMAVLREQAHGAEQTHGAEQAAEAVAG
jgi:hypothetical protein